MQLSGLKLAGMFMAVKSLSGCEKAGPPAFMSHLLPGLAVVTAKYSRKFTEIHGKTGCKPC